MIDCARRSGTSRPSGWPTDCAPPASSAIVVGTSGTEAEPALELTGTEADLLQRIVIQPSSCTDRVPGSPDHPWSGLLSYYRGRMGESTDSADRGVSCALCGVRVDAAPLEWMTELDPRRGLLQYCPGCARENVRAVEAKLPREWW